MKNDVAVVRTINRIVFGLTVQAIPIRTQSVPVGAQVMATGWGLLGDVINMLSYHEMFSTLVF